MEKIRNKTLSAANVRRIAAGFLRYSIFIFILLSVSGGVKSAHAAMLYISPSAGSYAAGGAFSVSVFASSTNQAMNAASGVVSFPADKLEIVSLSKAGSIISLWVQEPSFSNAAGTANFEGIVLNPGFTGSAGKIITVNFKAKAAGSAVLSFSSGSILANDGKGTNILNSLNSAGFTITLSADNQALPEPPKQESATVIPKGVPPAAKIYSSTHPDPESWYGDNNPEFSWNLAPDITGVSAYFTNKPTTNPGSVSDGVFNTKSYKNLADGIWYFHLKLKNASGWGPVSHYKVKIDTTPPKSFIIKFIDGKETDNPCPTVLFDTTDSVSGIAYYKVKVGGDNFNTVIANVVKSNPYTLACQEPGKKTILVQAFDLAGNYTIATDEIVIKPIASPVLIDFPKQLKTDETLIIKGTAIPNVEVTVMLAAGGDYNGAEKQTVKSDQNGNFTFMADEKLKEGVYEVWAAASDSRGAKSDPSEKISLEVAPPYAIKIGRTAIDYLTVINTLIVLVVGILAIIFYALYRMRLWRKRIKKETKETKDAVARAFGALRDEVEEQVAKIDGNPRLSRREKQTANSLKNALKVAEEFIEKEVNDIEDELK